MERYKSTVGKIGDEYGSTKDFIMPKTKRQREKFTSAASIFLLLSHLNADIVILEWLLG